MIRSLRASLRSSTTRLAGVVFVVEVLLGFTILTIMQRQVVREAQASAAQLAAQLSANMLSIDALNGTPGLAFALAARLRQVEDPDFVGALLDKRGRVVVGNVEKWPALPGKGVIMPVEMTRAVTGERTTATVAVSPTRDGGTLIVGRVSDRTSAVQKMMGRAFLRSMIIGLPLALLGALISARIIAARVKRFAVVAAAVRGGDLTRRVPLNGSGDAFDVTAGEVNAMLARIEELVGELRLVTDSLAHDLKSPLARLRLTVGQVEESSGQEREEAIASLKAESDRLQRLLTTALQISRTEAGMGRERFERLDAAAFVADLAEIYDAMAEDRGFALSVAASAPAMIDAHRALLGQALSNLIDNALKYGASPIVLAVSSGAAEVCIEVRDSGAGISEADRATALKRFGRLDGARSGEGAGLGLALVESVARLHHGRLELDDNRPGLIVRLVLPAAPSPRV